MPKPDCGPESQCGSGVKTHQHVFNADFLLVSMATSVVYVYAMFYAYLFML